jgi:hypothetical protein
MKKKLLITALIALAGVSIASAQCPSCSGAIKAEKAAVCEKCGEVKGSESCCKAGVANCPACGKHAGSPGCKAACKKQ